MSSEGGKASCCSFMVYPGKRAQNIELSAIKTGALEERDDCKKYFPYRASLNSVSLVMPLSCLAVMLV